MADIDVTTLSDNATEEWRDIPGYEGLYQVSNLGSVRGMTRFNSRGALVRGRKLKPGTGTSGRLFVLLSSEGKRRIVFVHRLVALAFIGVCPLGYQVNHIDSNYTNNHISNLEYCTHAENMAHYQKSKNFLRGDKAPWAKLTEKDVRNIRELAMNGVKQIALARMYKVNYRTISDVVCYRKWKHI